MENLSEQQIKYRIAYISKRIDAARKEVEQYSDELDRLTKNENKKPQTDKITNLGTKHLVLEVEDLDKYFSVFQSGVVATKEEMGFRDSIPFTRVLMDIDKLRKLEGKSIKNEYVCLNLDDDIDLHYLGMHCNYAPIKHGAKVKDIAVAMVTAILEAKNKKAAKNRQTAGDL